MFLPLFLKTVSPPTLKTTPDLVSVEVKNLIINFVPIYREDFLTNNSKKMSLYAA
jgi:hypothetical protein